MGLCFRKADRTMQRAIKDGKIVCSIFTIIEETRS